MRKEHLYFDNGIRGYPDPGVVRDAFERIRKTREHFRGSSGNGILGTGAIDPRTDLDLTSFVIFWQNRDRFVNVAIDDFRTDDQAGGDIDRRRSEALVDLLEEIFSSEVSSVGSVLEGIDFVSLDDWGTRSRNFRWNNLLENLTEARGGKFGPDAAVMARHFLANIPGSKLITNGSDGEPSGAPSNSVEYLENCVLPFRSHLFARMINETRATRKAKVRDLANRLANESGEKISAIYEFLAKVAGEVSWNHLAAKLKD